MLFTGNTHGVLLLDAIFENDVTLEVEVQFQLVLANDPYFMIMVMSDGGEKFYASNFGTDLRIYKEAREGVIQVTAGGGQSKY